MLKDKLNEVSKQNLKKSGFQLGKFRVRINIWLVMAYKFEPSMCASFCQVIIETSNLTYAL